ncbi:hypothetical protein FA09DRAFT_359686 [Tilletiopsis washingtonensis]|uniref:DUF453-domain-containing protein n=1 Tax=Tilletiopsis washingtonensis TaxID=58919 RepID=A0A316ZDF1_9BASI|nr:hypothetical protein FA09DRAFT_359686 [Tilletiopsis washingtonensis]PWN99078.1 hypothetical protein FA09DRAFT_359686 [Tilletiopsis washingtonensis]
MAPLSQRLRAVAATFYRGGTSRGLIFSPASLARFDAPTRDRIICTASSPDADLRQISGLGGGASSLSKCAVVSAPSDDWQRLARIAGHPFPGVSWAENFERASDSKTGWDCVFRFGQVPINGTTIDWGSTCGNLVAAVADYHLSSAAGASQAMKRLGRPAHGSDEAEQPRSMPLRILAHDSGAVVTARMDVYWHADMQRWAPATAGDAAIAGVPGTGAGVVIESPVSDVLPTGRPVDTINVDGLGSIDVSVVDTGLPTIFVAASSLALPDALLLAHPSVLEGDAAQMAKLEAVRCAAAQLTPELTRRLSPPAPKVCVVAPRAAYSTTGSEALRAETMDCLLRALSNGQVHRTVPATTLSAAAAAHAYRDSVVSRVVAQGGSEPCAASRAATEMASAGEAPGKVCSLTVGQPAGLSSASVLLSPTAGPGGESSPASVLMLRTARRIMHGHVLVPRSCAPFEDWANFMPPPPAQEGIETDDWRQSSVDGEEIPSFR